MVGLYIFVYVAYNMRFLNHFLRIKTGFSKMLLAIIIMEQNTVGPILSQYTQNLDHIQKIREIRIPQYKQIL